LLKQPKEQIGFLTQALLDMRADIKYCTSCHNISDTDICEICANKNKSSLVCVVEDIRDVMAIENTGQFRGIYHVLGGRSLRLMGLVLVN
jgi:recombination protein RecR